VIYDRENVKDSTRLTLIVALPLPVYTDIGAFHWGIESPVYSSRCNSSTSLCSNRLLYDDVLRFYAVMPVAWQNT